MATTIVFTDAIGTATLENGFPPPGDRFRSWQPLTRPRLDADHGLGTGARHAFVYGDRFGASFQLAELPPAAADLADRLVAHLLSGGTCAVTTGDAAARAYPTCGLWPDSTPALQHDQALNVWTLSLSVLNLAVGATRMTCLYP